MTFAAHLVLTVIWVIVTGDYSPRGAVIGFIVGYAVLLIVGYVRPLPYVRRLRGAVVLFVYATYELILANLRVAWYTVSSLRRLEPAVLGVPLKPDLTDGELTLLAMLITLTPGTLTLDVSEDRQLMFVHFMHVDDADRAIASITEGFERRILEATR